MTDGRYVYMRACATPDNQPLAEYTLMPTNMRGRFPVEALGQAELVPAFSFTKGVPVLKVPSLAPTNPAAFGTLLFDLQNDPEQEHPLHDAALELRMAELLVALMRQGDAPADQYLRLGLPQSGPVGTEHLLIGVSSPAGAGAVAPGEFDGTAIARFTVRELLAEEQTRGVLRDVLGPVVDGPLPAEAYGMTLVQIATVTVGMVPPEALRVISDRLDFLD